MRRINRLAAGVLAFLTIMPAVAGAQALVSGEVRKVDEAAGKITLTHGPFKKFGMDEGMTMVYRVRDPAMLKRVKPGDKVKFDAEQVNGAFTITRIEKAK